MHALDKSPSFMSGSTGFELRDKINGYVVDAKAFAFMSILFTDFNLDFYLEVQNLKYLVRTMGDSPFNRRYRCGAVFLPQTLQLFDPRSPHTFALFILLIPCQSVCMYRHTTNVALLQAQLH